MPGGSLLLVLGLVAFSGLSPGVTALGPGGYAASNAGLGNTQASRPDPSVARRELLMAFDQQVYATVPTP